MENSFKTLLKIERDSQFSTRVIILSIPSALLFVALASFNLLSPWTAFLCYILIIMFNVVFLFPLNYELQILRKYIYSLGKDSQNLQTLKLVEKDTQDLANAINSLHRLWTAKTDSLEAQTMSDAAVLNTLPDPILLLDGEGNITSANLPALNFLGTNIQSRNIDKLFSTNIFIASIEKVLKNKSESQSLVFHAPEYNNRQIYAHITKLPDYVKGRSVAVITLSDVTKAFSLEKMQSDFVANASHELRTPLSVISGFIETLQTSAKDDEEARDAFLAIMKEQTEYMSALIEDLLSLSRLEMGQDKELKDKVDIQEVIDDVIQALKIKAFQHSINIKVTSAQRIPKVIGDNQQIHQIVQNLLDNAIKYAQEKSEVLIDLKIVPQIPVPAGQSVGSGKAVSIAINNKGQKINKEDLVRLTEKFYRMQVHKDMKIKGTGLGLAIAKQIILHHHGNLTVSSTTHKGTTFTVYLPLKQK